MPSVQPNKLVGQKRTLMSLHTGVTGVPLTGDAVVVDDDGGRADGAHDVLERVHMAQHGRRGLRRLMLLQWGGGWEGEGVSARCGG